MVYQFWLPFVLLWIIMIYLDRRSGMLRDSSTANPRPYSWSRVQLAWWSVIVLSSLIAIIWKDMQVAPPANIPTLHYSTLVLLGISAATTTVARIIDVNDKTDNNPALRHQDLPASNFFVDIISDQNGISIHRLQALIFNLVFGVWFIGTVLYDLVPGNDPCSLYIPGSQLANACKADPLDFIMPVITDNNLILLGLSSATYAAMKTTENRSQMPTVPVAGTTTTTVSTTAPVTGPATTVTTATNVSNTPQ
jgi:hypothetical protein